MGMATVEAAVPFSGLRFGPQTRTLNPPSARLSRCRGRINRSLSLKFSLVGGQQVQEQDQISSTAFSEEENALISALIGIQGRGAPPLQPNYNQMVTLLQEVEKAVQRLESSKGITDPTGSSLIEGRWQLMFTTRPGTASPIQRTFVGVDSFSVFQEAYLRTDDPRVSNIVKFSDAIGKLKVEAVASIKDGKRILFRFDRAAFSLKFLPFKVPYPIPFRFLGYEAKGSLDTTYLSQSGNIRISLGNKGTTFVLQKETEPRQRLLSAISSGGEVKEAIDEFVASNQGRADKEFELVQGEWLMIWSSQKRYRQESVEIKIQKISLS